MTETALLLNSLRMLSLNEEQRKEMIKRLLPSVDKTIEEEEENPFNTRFFWKEFRDVLLDIRKTTEEIFIKDWINQRIEKIEWVHLRNIEGKE